MKWRILNVEPAGYSDEARAILGGLGEVVERPSGRRELLELVPRFDVLIVRLAHQLDREMLDAGQRLKAIVTATTGLDHIDTGYAQSRGIAVLSLKGEREFLEGISATAEHTWALLLALVRRVPEAFASVRMGQWHRDAFRGRTLAGLRLGLVGLGRIGRTVARYGMTFGMRVAAYDPQAAHWPPEVERRGSVAELLAQTDVLSLHLPLEEATRGYIGEEALRLLPRGTELVNTARGELVEEAALAAALASGHLAGAAVDVLCHEREPGLRGESPLLAYARNHENLIITPHIGGATVEAMAATELFMAKKLAEFLSGRTKSETGNEELNA